MENFKKENTFDYVYYEDIRFRCDLKTVQPETSL